VRRSELRILLFISAYALAVRLMPGIASADFGSAWDEGYYAIAARSALERPLNLLFPFVFEADLERTLINKPPGLFWLGALTAFFVDPPELGLRLVSVLSGAATPALLFALLRPYAAPGLALAAAGVLAASPLHVAFSRVFQMDVLDLFYALLATHLILRGLRRGEARAIYWAAPVVALALLTKLYSPVLPVVALLPFFYREAGRDARRLFFHVLGALAAGTLAFALWPLLLAIEHDRYVTFLWMKRGASVWELLFSFYGTELWGPDANHLLGQLFVSYQGLGHFDTGLLGTPLELLLLAAGAIACFWQRPRPASLLPLVSWALAFLPVHLGQRHYLQYLVMLVPLWSILVARGLVALPELLPRVGGVAAVGVGAWLLVVPARMILTGNEVLYETHYRRMADHVGPDGAGRVAVRYMPGFSYYTGRLERPFGRVSPLEASVRRGRVHYVDVKRDPRDDILSAADRAWVVKYCSDVSARAGIPDDAAHALFDCRAAK
jgi:4-amino-4-deoxy-L-arabinose transferase-like glycosyltransferase